jgi:hypothetical protein
MMIDFPSCRQILPLSSLGFVAVDKDQTDFKLLHLSRVGLYRAILPPESERFTSSGWITVQRNILMKKMKKILRRDIVKTGHAGDKAQGDAVKKSENQSACSGTAIVHCNQWECFTRFLCLEKDSDTEPVGSI